MLKLVLILATVIACFGTRTYVHAENFDHPMTFKLSGTGGNCLTCEWIAAEGVITEDTPEIFKRFVINDLYSLGGVVAFNSPGGNLLAALKLGTLLRELGFETTVADTIIAATDDSVRIDSMRRTEWEGLEHGMYASACAWAFVGGVVRHLNYAGTPGHIGLHQFYNLAATLAPNEKFYTGADQQNFQVLQGILINYLNEMGVDAQFLMKANLTPHGEMYWVSEMEAREWRLDNSGHYYTQWELIPDKNGLSARSMYISGAYGVRIYKMYCLGSDNVYIELKAPNGENNEFAAEIYNREKVDLVYGSYKLVNLQHFSLIDNDSLFLITKVPASDLVRLISAKSAQDIEISWSYPRILSWYGYGSSFPVLSAEMLNILLRNCPT